MIELPMSHLIVYLRHQWVIAILALAFVGVLQLVGSGTAHAHSVPRHSSQQYQSADLSQPLERQAVVVAFAFDDPDHCQGQASRYSGDRTTPCCGTAGCAAALAAASESGMTRGDSLVAIMPFYPQFIIADVVFGLDRPPDFSV